MPWTLDTPPSEMVPVDTSTPITTERIARFEVVTVAGDPSAIRMEVQIEKGYLDGGSNFVPTGGRQVTLGGTEFVTMMNLPVVGGKSHYDDFKETLYAHLVAEGYIEAGTVS